jgi:virulence-associated protein VagC
MVVVGLTRGVAPLVLRPSSGVMTWSTARRTKESSTSERTLDVFTQDDQLTLEPQNQKEDEGREAG